ncbi:hypothetical protein [Marinobacter nauticus]|uniref:Uncharacterized protein n=1 Tax=Marinobacter nauticus TaxID=2743 RepID=A0A1M2V0T3_MARNT|nr:hypothetical protein [Marinobacter nauticus]OJT01194.1 hypothetical protein BEE62_14680 [Marinobacter nauticus]
MSDLPLHRTMQDDEIDRLKAQLKETEEKGRVLVGMCRDLKARVTELLTVCQAVQRDLLLRAEPDWDGSGQQVVNLSAGFWEELNRVIGKYDDTACKSFDALILRKQAEAVENYSAALGMWLKELPGKPCASFVEGVVSSSEQADRYAKRLRQQAAEAERAGGVE